MITEEIDVAALALGVRRCDETASDTLYHLIRGRFPLALGKLGWADFEDQLHTVFAIVIQTIRSGRLRDPGALLAYVHSVIRKQTCVAIRKRVRSRPACSIAYVVATSASTDRNPEQELMAQERMAIAQRAFRSLRPIDRGILLRFYVRREPQAEICAAMNLTDTQFRLLKWRAKARFAAKVSQLAG